MTTSPFLLSLGALLVVFVSAAPPVSAAVVKWKAEVDGKWDDPTKWSTGKVPGPNDDVVDDFTNHEIRFDKGSHKVKSFKTKGGFDLRAGTLEVTNGITNEGGFGINGGTLKDTILTTALRGRLSISNSDRSVLDGVVFQGIGTDVFHRAGGTVTIKNGFSADGIIRMENGSKMVFDGTQTFKNGAIAFEGNGKSVIDLTPGTVLSLGSPAKPPKEPFAGKVTVIRGTGANAAIGSRSNDPKKPTAIVMAGEAEFSGSDYVIAADRVVNDGNVFVNTGVGSKVQAGEFVNRKGATYNAAHTHAIEAGTFTNEGSVKGGIAFEISAATFENSGTITVDAGQKLSVSGQPAGQSAVNHGRVIVNGELTFLSGYTQKAGRTRVDGRLTIQRDGTKTTGVLEGGDIGGIGRVNGNLSAAQGIVKPGKSPGIFSIEGDYAQLALGRLEIELGGTDFDPVLGLVDYDQLAIDGTATLEGLLQVFLVDGFVPSFDDEFTILTAAGLQGFF